jgi:flagellar hook assembly protein FlgD
LGSFQNQVSISPNTCIQYATISYQLSKPGMVSARIFNMLGQQVRTVFSGSRQAGAYSVRWDGKNAKGQAVPAGVYVLRLSAGEQMFTRRITLLK